MNTVKYLMLSGLMTISGAIFGAEIDRDVEIKRMHAATTKEELDAAEKDGLLDCPLVTENGIRGNFCCPMKSTYLLSSIVTNPKAGADLIHVLASKGPLSSVGAFIGFSGGRVDKSSLFNDLLMRSTQGDLPQYQLNSLDQLRKKCKTIVALTHLPLRSSVRLDGCSDVDFLYAIVKYNYDLLKSFPMHASQLDKRGEVYKRNIKYALTMAKAVDEVSDEQYKDLDLILDDTLIKFSRDLVKMVRLYIVSDEELKDYASIKRLLSYPQSKQVLQEIEQEFMRQEATASAAQ